MRSPGTVWQVLSALLVILAIILQWYGHHGGLLTTSDSCDYVSASVSFKTAHTFLRLDGTPYVYWPPLFPVILSLFDNPAGVFYWVNMLLAGWIGIMIVVYTQRIINDPAIRFLCQASILLGVHLLLIGVFLWSELLFIVLLFYFTQCVVRSVDSRNAFIAAIVIGFLLCLQRNAGLFFVTGAVVWYGKNFRRSVILFVLSTSGFFAWNIYRSILGGHEYFQWLVPNFNFMSRSVAHIFAPVPGIFFFVIVAVAGWLLRSEIKGHPMLRLWSIMIGAYLIGIAALFHLDVDDGDRYTAVIVPFFAILAFRAIEIAISKQTSHARILLTIVVVCWMAYPLSRTIKNVRQWHEVSYMAKCNKAK